MTKPIPWSPSSLDTFVNCPHQYHETKVLKHFKSEQGEEQLWGEYVHKKFQERQDHRLALPMDLQDHEDYMKKLEAHPGHFACEKKVALDVKAHPCHFFDKEVFGRGVIDYQKADVDTELAWVIDYKTGKLHDKWKQLAFYAIHTFMEFPFVKLVNAQFYWTQTMASTKKVWSREEMPALWGMIIPDLRQYKEAFNADVWQKRPSGLCRGWCPVVSCEHYQTKRR